MTGPLIHQLVGDEPIAACSKCGHRAPADELFVGDDFQLICVSCYLARLDEPDPDRAP